MGHTGAARILVGQSADGCPIEMVGLRALRRRCESILPGANVSPIAKSAISRLTRCSIEKWHLSAPHIEVQ